MLRRDLALGAVYYRKLINIASGWVHHSVYTVLFAIVLHNRWTHIAATGAIFELPTLIMGMASMFPKLRSNIGFTVTFLITRVFFHAAIIYALATDRGLNAPFIEGSYMPVSMVSLPFPMHLWWGYKALRSMQRRAAKRKLQKRMRIESDNSFAVAAGQFFNGVPAPDITSALNTPATTPGSAGSSGVTHAQTNFGATGPVNGAFQKAIEMAGKTTRPMRLFIGKRDKSSKSNSRNSSGPATGATTPMGIEILQNPFTAPIAPEGAGDSAKEPFLAIRSPAETSDRARRLIADAVRKAWNNAPEAWRKQVEKEARMRSPGASIPPRIPLTRGGSSYVLGGSSEDSDPTSSSEEDEDRLAFDDAASEVISSPKMPLSPQQAAAKEEHERDRRAAARRAVIKAVRRAINGRDSDGMPRSAKAEGKRIRRVLNANLPVDFGALLRKLPPDFWSQDYQVREFPVETDESDSRRKRLVGQIRRRMQIARRDVMVFE